MDVLVLLAIIGFIVLLFCLYCPKNAEGYYPYLSNSTPSSLVYQVGEANFGDNSAAPDPYGDAPDTEWVNRESNIGFF